MTGSPMLPKMSFVTTATLSTVLGPMLLPDQFTGRYGVSVSLNCYYLVPSPGILSHIGRSIMNVIKLYNNSLLLTLIIYNNNLKIFNKKIIMFQFKFNSNTILVLLVLFFHVKYITS